MDNFTISYQPFGATSILVTWPSTIEKSTLNDIISFEETICSYFGNEVETVPAYNSLTVIFKSNIYYKSTLAKLQELYNQKKAISKVACNLWKVPVCYEEAFGIDLKELAEAKNVTTQEIITLHTAQSFTVYGIGFLPGFMYLGGLPEALHYPRRSSPRTKVIKGAVGIGGMQTGIYPQESPGGWNIIGNSPIHFFDPNKKQPCFAKVGDQVQFYSVTKPQYDIITIEVATGIFNIKSEIFYHD
ncbi:5-oxoprolinase subunit PxpB [Zhouia sp. PK063]|uniref:5-oxoprolinase subunit PxpB n=1 Tax=Zhouia sp. PK063 TaxID=3373602 RepID=UPI0037AAF800